MSSLLTVSTQTPLKFGLGSETVRSGAGSAACATAGSRKASRPTMPAPAASETQRHPSHEPTAGTPSSLIPFLPSCAPRAGPDNRCPTSVVRLRQIYGAIEGLSSPTTNARAQLLLTADGMRGRDRSTGLAMELDEGGLCWLRRLRPRHALSRLPWNEPAFQYVEEREGDQAQG